MLALSRAATDTDGVFTGIITQTAAVRRHAPDENGLVLTFARPASWIDLELGESIATNGACLTVAALRDDEYDCHLMSETLEKTTFGLAVPETVNLERSLSVADRFGGHFVQGHVDGMGRVSSIDKADGWVVNIEFAPEFAPLVIPKGSICVDGASLTVASTHGHRLSVALIPHTLEHTTLGKLRTGHVVNLEFDMVGKYIAKMMEAREADASSNS